MAESEAIVWIDKHGVNSEIDLIGEVPDDVLEVALTEDEKLR